MNLNPPKHNGPLTLTKEAAMEKSTRRFSYHADMLQHCPEILPYLAKANTPFGKLGLMMVCSYAPYIQSGTRSQEDINNVFFFATLMSGIPAEVLLAFAQRSFAAMNGEKLA